jgi:hypothetical protein
MQHDLPGGLEVADDGAVDDHGAGADARFWMKVVNAELAAVWSSG